MFAMVWSSTNRIELSGEVQAREVRNASRFGGRIEKILVEEGQQVTKGQPLILFDDVDLQARIADSTLEFLREDLLAAADPGAAGRTDEPANAVARRAVRGPCRSRTHQRYP